MEYSKEMKYHVWLTTEDMQPIKYLQLLSKNKRKLKGKWQVFVKGITKGIDDAEILGYRLRVEDEYYMVLDDREEVVYKTKPDKYTKEYEDDEENT